MFEKFTIIETNLKVQQLYLKIQKIVYDILDNLINFFQQY